MRLLLCNVLTSNRNSEGLIEIIKTEKPDIVLLQEVDYFWMQNLESLNAVYPHAKSFPRSDNFGIAVMSGLPLANAREFAFGAGEVPSILADVEFSGNTISILTTHTLPPVDREYFDERNAQLSDIAAFIQGHPQPVILVGDLNVTMWSPYYGRLIRDAKLVNARKGIGILPTWPVNLPILKIPLDHCLVSAGIKVANIKTGQAMGSDHLPLIVDLLIPKKP